MEGRLCFSISALSLFLITSSLLFSLSYSKTHWQDIESLKELRNAVVSSSLIPGSCLSSWDFSVDPCDSLFRDKFTCGFSCDDVVQPGSSRVTELSLDQAGYSGSLDTLSWNLPYLQTLDLSGNYFTGSIPEPLSKLTRLKRLGLSRNSLSGSIPDSIGSLSSLEELYLDGNLNLHGRIPASLNNLSNLRRLEIQGNKLSGEFPDLGQLSNLYYLDASDNGISGELPATLPASLVELSMRNNQLEGNIPGNIMSLPYLQVMDLSHNKLTGSVPWILFTHPSLQQLTLSHNQFGSVQVPVDLGIRSELIAVDLSNNQLRGLLPTFMGMMPKLSALSLENNKFSGMIPTQYALRAVVPGNRVAQFGRLLLGGNYLFGPIPNPFLGLKPGSVMVRLGDNCLYRCPVRFFFCGGGEQKSLMDCKNFGTLMP